MKIAGMILAAGESKRLGTSKQLVEHIGHSLIYNAVKKCKELDVSKTYVVTGSKRESVLASITDLAFEEIYNPNFKQGMLSSIQLGINHCKNEKFDAVLIMLVDQYLIPQSHYRRLLEAAREKKESIICSSYKNTFGAPTIFKASMFDQILNLTSHQNTKSLISENTSMAIFIECEEAGTDVDYPEDLLGLVQKNKQ